MTNYDLLKGSDARLWDLIELRTKPDADTDAVDRRIWDLFGERWAIMFTDLSGFSRHAAKFGITHFLQIIHEKKKMLLPIVAAHDGILLKVEADSFLIIFRRPDRALQCAIEMQRRCQLTNERRLPEEQIILCLGIGYGDVLRVGDHDVWGREVNAASKLGEDTAGPNEILVTGAAQAELGAITGVRYELIDDKIPGSDVNYRCLYL
ncbi:MAG: adenylate/guanylate cyclase domain-containing protein [Sandaracinaceae bacterium]|jgi:adenylate cyclase|nr:adenylate/guanylate cyclase domain-containing protein [Sandaracinaceae bacterium]MBP7683730.1 adenylate/guanylate cyclase domain-containing protein [Deltaproteobacteria bacterium]MBK6811190.1 adenylate/guanylate cyclase domain-containing protein [Sandaracinaceae bacterium]MBK7151750.1 adenylate/guanylate cyclase domain-containing protein [Sandaracinaceae bacterium]MBK7773284.1 adenylate/guanylate cyclase domain-containing protein [Sandaracinaceae bacterium]